MNGTDQGCRRAEEILQGLKTHYANYVNQEEPGRSGWDFSSLFKGWFSNSARQEEPIHMAFFRGTQSLSHEFAASLKKMETSDPAGSRRLALEGVKLILMHRFSEAGRNHRAYLMAAEQFCVPLLPYLSKEQLREQRQEMLATTPKRMMLPKQLEVLKEMDALLP